MANQDNINLNIAVNLSTVPAVAVAPFAYNFDDQPIRVFTIDGDPWFVAADVCGVLEIKNPSHALTKLDEDERGQVKDAMNSNSLLNVVNESGLYALILTSRKPEAKRLRKWVTSEVMPKIRKTGSYVAPQPAVERISANQYYQLAAAVGLLEDNCHSKRAATDAAYAALRQTFGVETTIKNLPAAQFDAALAIVASMNKITLDFKKEVMDAERSLFRDVFRHGNGFNAASLKAELTAAVDWLVAKHQSSPAARGVAA